MHRTRLRRWLLSMFLFTILLLGFLAWAAEHYVEPILRERIGILIVQGSSGLYRYKMARLEASLFGGQVEIDGLQMFVDSTRYRQLAAESRLPAITVNIDMPHGHLRGVGLWSLLAGRQVRVDELFTADARIELWRNSRDVQRSAPPPPVWKAIRPSLAGISVKRLRLEGIRFAYRYATDSSNMQLKFDTCTALIRDIRIDSAAAVDPERIGFCRYVSLHFYDLKFRSPDSSFKMKAKVIDYSSEGRLLSIQGFKMQPTRKDKESFYKGASLQQEMTVIEFDRLDLKRFRLEDFFNGNVIRADSLVVDAPQIQIYTDKTLPPTLEGKSGRYPHQSLLKAGNDIDIGTLALRHASLTYTERAEKSGQEGTLKLEGLNIIASNVTNIAALIAKDSLCRMRATGRIQGSSPITVNFDFNLTDTFGRFKAEGSISNVHAGQLNGLAEPLAYVRLQRFDMQELRFSLRGDDYGAYGDVQMRYRNLYLELQKEDRVTGLLQSKKFINKIINKFTLLHDNPDASGREMMAKNVQQSRLMTQTFFGLIWKTVFGGMQTIMTNTGEPVP
jgi:hypothetical protein